MAQSQMTGFGELLDSALKGNGPAPAEQPAPKKRAPRISPTSRSHHLRLVSDSPKPAKKQSPKPIAEKPLATYWANVTILYRTEAPSKELRRSALWSLVRLLRDTPTWHDANARFFFSCIFNDAWKHGDIDLELDNAIVALLGTVENPVKDAAL